jgi:MFS family permease
MIIRLMLRILRQPNFARLWFGGLISMIGDWILIVGLPFEIYRRTGSTLATGAMVLAFLVPSIALGSVAGVFVDRWDRQRLMVIINLILAVGILPLLAIDALGIWIAYVVLFGMSCLEQLFHPAEHALMPNLLENQDDDLVTANALNGLNNHLARMIGPVLAGLIVATGGLLAVTIVDAVSFLIAAGLIASIRTEHGRAKRHDSLEHEAATAWRRLVLEWRDGLRVIFGHPVLRALLFFFIITRIGEGLTMTLFVPWTKDALGSNETGYGLLLATQAIGGFAGALVIGRFGGSRIDPLRLMILSALAFGLIDLGLFTYPAIYPHIEPALVVMVIVGVPGAGMMAAIATLQQTLAADSHRGRVIGAMMAMGAAGSLVGATAAGFLGEVVPIVLLLVVQGSGYVIGSMTVAWLTRGSRTTSAALPANELGVEPD